jgi:hypothetical protein
MKTGQRKQKCFVHVSEIPLSASRLDSLNLSRQEIGFFLDSVFRGINGFSIFQDLDMTKPYAVLVQNFCLTNGISALTHPSKWDMGKFGASTNEQRRKFRKVFKQVMHVGNFLFEKSGIDQRHKGSLYKVLDLEHIKKLPQKRSHRFKKELVQRFFLFNSLLVCSKMNVSDAFMPNGAVFAWNRMLFGDR